MFLTFIISLAVFYDILIFSVGKEIHNMVAHLDAVTSLSIDASGLYILSGSKCLYVS